MGFNSGFKGLICVIYAVLKSRRCSHYYKSDSAKKSSGLTPELCSAFWLKLYIYRYLLICSKPFYIAVLFTQDLHELKG